MRAGMWRRVIACIRRAEIDAPSSKANSKSQSMSMSKSANNDADYADDGDGSTNTSQAVTAGAGLPVKATTAAMLMRAYAELGTNSFPVPVFDFSIFLAPISPITFVFLQSPNQMSKTQPRFSRSARRG